MSVSAAAPDRIVWRCSTCGGPAAGGFVHVELRRVAAAESAEREWQARRPAGSDVDVVDIFAMPERASWRVDCRSCVHDCGGCYSIELARCVTHRQLIEWTAHLYDKRWFAATNWMHFVLAAVRESVPSGEAVVW